MVLKLDLTINGSNVDELKKGAVEIVKHVRPSWKIDQLQFKVYTEGITNQLIGVWYEQREDQILVRVYGSKTELFIDRDAEKKNIQMLSAADLCPPLYAIFTNGISYGFVTGCTLNTATIRDDQIWPAVTKAMSKLHKINESKQIKPMLFPKLRQFWNLLPDKFEDEDKQKRIEESGFTKERLCKEIDELEPELTNLNCPVVFSHNDILLGNTIWNSNDKTASFIDYEYGDYNYQPYDIGNHFNEFAGMDEVDYNLYPEKDFQLAWLRSYLSNFKGIPIADVHDEEVKTWYTWVNKFSVASHLFWGIWAFLQAYHSLLDFDFLGYGFIRLNEYSRKRKIVFS